MMMHEMTPQAQSQRDSQSSMEHRRYSKPSQDDENIGRMIENSESQGSELLTQSELMTQTELTQLGDFDDSQGLSPLAPQSPMHPKSVPWGRIIPCSKHWSPQDGEQRGGIDLLPKEMSEQSAASSQQETGVSFLGLENVMPSHVFNEYALGRSNKCDVIAIKTPRDTGQDKDTIALQDWSHAMISNRHCKIYCMLKPTTAECTTIDMDVYIEDTSGNGTLINNTTLLRRGEKRLLHTGDEICLVNPTTLRKKVRSTALLNDLQRHHSFIFVNLHSQQGHSILDNARQQSSSSISAMLPPSSVKPLARRAGIVDVRAMKNHSLVRPNFASDLHTTRLAASRQASPKRASVLRRVEQEYDVRDLLGSGTCGEVRRAIHRQSGKQFAVKMIPLGGRNRANVFNEEVSAAFEAEVTILKSLNHPYVVKLVDVFVSPGQAVYLVMELLQGDLFDRIVQKGKYTEDESRRVVRRLLNAIYHLHEIKNIVHRDLKPENILCSSRDSDIDVKLTDFGLAKSVTEDGLKTFCGTPQYFAPEVLRRRHTIAGRGRYGKEADMWSLGVILYILLSGMPPFDVSASLDCVVDAKIEFPDDRWRDISEEAKDLVRKLLVSNPQNRISVKDACEHKWLLTDDGDTHTHPLDDPAVPLTSNHARETLASNRRLFTRDNAHDQNSAVKEPPKADSSQKEDDSSKSVVRTDTDENAAHSSEAKTTESPVCPMSQGTIQASNAAKSNAAPSQEKVSIPFKPSHDVPIGVTDSTKKVSRILLPSLSTSCNVPEPSIDGDKAVGKNDDNTKSTMQPVSDTPAQASHPTPSSLNARSNHFRDLVAKNTDNDPPSGLSSLADPFNRLAKQQQKADLTDQSTQKISPEDKKSPRGILITPKSTDSVMTKVVPNRLSTEMTTRPEVERKEEKPKKKKACRKVKISSVESRAAELSEDEICSQFSDDEEDISSCSTSTEEASDDPSLDNAKSSDGHDGKRHADDSDAPTQKRKKRRIVFGQLGRSVAAREEEGAEVSEDDAAGKSSSKSTTSSKTKSKASTKAKASKSDTNGGRQTTLSSWFRKPT